MGKHGLERRVHQRKPWPRLLANRRVNCTVGANLCQKDLGNQEVHVLTTEVCFKMISPITSVLHPFWSQPSLQAGMGVCLLLVQVSGAFCLLSASQSRPQVWSCWQPQRTPCPPLAQWGTSRMLDIWRSRALAVAVRRAPSVGRFFLLFFETWHMAAARTTTAPSVVASREETLKLHQSEEAKFSS